MVLGTSTTIQQTDKPSRRAQKPLDPRTYPVTRGKDEGIWKAFRSIQDILVMYAKKSRKSGSETINQANETRWLSVTWPANAILPQEEEICINTALYLAVPIPRNVGGLLESKWRRAVISRKPLECLWKIFCSCKDHYLKHLQDFPPALCSGDKYSHLWLLTTNPHRRGPDVVI